MGTPFDPKKLLKASSLNPKEKILAEVNKRASTMTSKLSGEIAGKLASAGQSLKSATAYAAAKTDALLSSAPKAFSTMAAMGGGSPAIERISRKDLVNSRMGNLGAFDPQTVIPQAREDGSYTDTKVYPADLGDLEYRITFDFMEYKRPSLSESANTEVRFSISLPIPATLMESYGIGYSEGRYGATLGNVIAAVDRQNAGIGAEESRSSATALGLARGAFQSSLASAAGGIGSAVGIDSEGVSGVIDQQLGSIVNPHLSLFFTGVSMREHQFFWAFAPRNAQDAKNIKEIYYRIKRAALPTFTPNASHTTLEYPMMVRVRIFTKGGEELYPFKMCVIPGINMNYASSGAPAFHIDGSPALCQLSMSLKEIEYFTSDDIRERQGEPYQGIEPDFAQNQVGLDAFEDFLNGARSTANTLMQTVSNNPSFQGIGLVGGQAEE